MDSYRQDLRELLRDGSLSQRQQLTIRLMYQHYGKKHSIYLILVTTLGWLGIHRYYVDSDVMNGLMSPLCLSFPLVAPLLYLSQHKEAWFFGLGWLALLYIIALCEVPFHWLKIKRNNTDLKQFLQEHVKN
ncbi:MAG: hypothetical protein HEQ32_02255 [Vampirovibrio sp.]